MLILIETAVGYALFELKDKGILKDVSSIFDKFVDPNNAQSLFVTFNDY